MSSTVEIILKSTDQSAAGLRSATQNFKGLNEQVAKQNSTLKTAKMSMTELFSATQLVAQGIAAMKKGYNFAREGAQIEFTRLKFENLTKSIGTTSSALMTDLKSATRGTLSDMELMAAATDIVGLGLANSHDEAVRLATVSAGLNMNMNQLTLTLANMTTMRFDALGVRVDGFKERVKALEEQGYDTEAAFKEAFLQQAEAQLRVVGHAADSTLGSFQRLEAQIKNISDSSKQLAAQGLGPLVDGLADNLVWSAKFRTTLQEINPELYQQFQTTQIVTDEMEVLVNEYQRAQQYGLAWGAALKDSTVSLEENTAAAELNAEQLKAITEENKEFISTLENVAGNLDDYNDGLAEADAQLAAGKITAEEHGSKVAELAGQYEEASKRIVASLLEMKYMADGTFTDEEMVQYLKGLEKLGLITEADRQATIALYEEATNLHTELGKTTSQADIYNTKMERLKGRTDDAVAGFEDLNSGMANTADAFAEASGPISDVTMTLGDLPKSGTMWSYYVHTTYSEDGKAPKLPKGGGQHEQITPGGGGYASGGYGLSELGVGEMASVGEVGEEGIMRTDKGLMVIPANEWRMMKQSGMVPDRGYLFGTEDNVYTEGSGTLYAAQQAKKNKKKGGGGGGTLSSFASSSSDSGGGAEEVAAEVAAQAIAFLAPELQQASAQTAAVLAASTAAAARQTQKLDQMIDVLEAILSRTPSEQGIARATRYVEGGLVK